MNPHAEKIIGLVLIGILLVGDKFSSGIEGFELPEFSVGAASEGVSVSREAKKNAADVRKLLGHSKDDSRVKAELKCLANGLADKDSAIETTGQLRSAIKQLGVVRGKLGPAGLGDAVNDALKDALGEEDVEFDKDLRASGAELLQAMGS